MKKILLTLASMAFAGAFLCPERELSSTTENIYCSRKAEKPAITLLSSPNPETRKTETSPAFLEEVIGGMSEKMSTHITNVSSKLEDYTNFFAEMMKRPPPPATETQLKLSPYSLLQPQLYLVLRRSSNSYGKPKLLHTLELSAEYMQHYYGTALLVSDLSSACGGRLRPHRSHRKGLDADVGIYWYKDGWYGNTYRKLNGKLEEQTLAVNWDFIKVLQDAGDIQYIIWNRGYVKRMENYVLAHRGKEEWKQYGEVLHPWSAHKDHFHIRVKEDAPDEKLMMVAGSKGRIYSPKDSL